jgi:hypothetical protein
MGLPREIGISRADDDAGVIRPGRVEAQEVSTIQGQDCSRIAARHVQDFTIWHAPVGQASFGGRPYVMAEAPKVPHDLQREVLVREETRLCRLVLLDESVDLGAM